MDLTPKKHSGTKNELVAAVWLLQQGYEVFRNISPHGDVDIIAMKGNTVTLVDVKAASYTLTGQPSLNANRLKESQIALGVLRLNVYFDGRCEFVSAVTLESQLHTRHCKNCGDQFKPRQPDQVFCCKRCTQLFHYVARTGKTPKSQR